MDYSVLICTLYRTCKVGRKLSSKQANKHSCSRCWIVLGIDQDRAFTYLDKNEMIGLNGFQHAINSYHFTYIFFHWTVSFYKDVKSVPNFQWLRLSHVVRILSINYLYFLYNYLYNVHLIVSWFTLRSQSFKVLFSEF
jgi:hypothetical protein